MISVWLVLDINWIHYFTELFLRDGKFLAVYDPCQDFCYSGCLSFKMTLSGFHLSNVAASDQLVIVCLYL